ncbi:MAG: hypothetical protein HC922_00235 [Leptolyngbyaceae cyanobacterium SM2_3_12]|nr:hypothetical protein [Leptolyngbyaceae cyanobacterium SM2_3_12]
MSAALKSYVPRPTRSRSRAAVPVTKSTALNSAVAPALDPPSGQQPARPVPLVRPSSPVFQALTSLHLVSSVLATALVGLALVSYGVSVYIDRELNQATQQLNQLQRNEQQLTTVNEVLKNHMAQQAEEPNAGLEPPQPGSVIFLRPAPQRPVKNLAQPMPRRFALPQVESPLGY